MSIDSENPKGLVAENEAWWLDFETPGAVDTLGGAEF